METRRSNKAQSTKTEPNWRSAFADSKRDKIIGEKSSKSTAAMEKSPRVKASKRAMKATEMARRRTATTKVPWRKARRRRSEFGIMDQYHAAEGESFGA
ncbi:hypothetical protein PanWU01x14_321710 [Parasponia andersonii]|uniref:Uncharacterized protein n=1 Tax=Parasponia andersonii TaxID=3476 RepID=A0A2P5AL39_PARAD|nr:hypothetical protein PanWU01x14_321710 [Parasponia andersonii]